MDRTNQISKLTTLVDKMTDSRGNWWKQRAAYIQFKNLVNKDLLPYVKKRIRVILHSSISNLSNRNSSRLFAIRALGVLGGEHSLKLLGRCLKDPNRRIQKETEKVVKKLSKSGNTRATSLLADHYDRNPTGMKVLWVFLTKPIIWIWDRTFGSILGWIDEYGYFFLHEDIPTAIKLTPIIFSSIILPPFGVYYVTIKHRKRVENHKPWAVNENLPLSIRLRFIIRISLLGCLLWSIFIGLYWTFQHAVVFLMIALIICYIIWLNMKLVLYKKHILFYQYLMDFYNYQFLSTFEDVTIHLRLLFGRPMKSKETYIPLIGPRIYQRFILTILLKRLIINKTHDYLSYYNYRTTKEARHSLMGYSGIELVKNRYLYHSYHITDTLETTVERVGKSQFFITSTF